MAEHDDDVTFKSATTRKDIISLLKAWTPHQVRADHVAQLLLIDEGLDKALIEGQTDDELAQSIMRADALSVRMRDPAEVKALAPSLSDVAVDHLQRLILDKLFEAKSNLLTESWRRKASQKLEYIDVKVEETVVDREQQEDLKKLVRDAVKNAMAESSGLQGEIAIIDAKRAELALINDQQEMEHKRKQLRSEMRRAWFQRESIASIVGAFLLLAFGLAVIVAAFTGTDVSGLLSNAFLLILGYFFGQATSRKSKGEGE